MTAWAILKSKKIKKKNLKSPNASGDSGFEEEDWVNTEDFAAINAQMEKQFKEYDDEILKQREKMRQKSQNSAKLEHKESVLLKSSTQKNIKKVLTPGIVPKYRFYLG